MKLLACLLVTVAFTFGLFAQPDVRAGAQIEISGDWNLTLSSGLTCTTNFVQSGTVLSQTFVCENGAVGTATGSIDTVTGDFSLSGSHTFAAKVNLTGTVTSDGNSMSGTVTSVTGSFVVTESFTGTRKAVAPTPVVVGGIASDLEGHQRGLPRDSPDSAGASTETLVAVVAAAILAPVAMGLAYLGIGRRRRQR